MRVCVFVCAWWPRCVVSSRRGHHAHTNTETDLPFNSFPIHFTLGFAPRHLLSQLSRVQHTTPPPHYRPLLTALSRLCRYHNSQRIVIARNNILLVAIASVTSECDLLARPSLGGSGSRGICNLCKFPYGNIVISLEVEVEEGSLVPSMRNRTWRALCSEPIT